MQQFAKQLNKFTKTQHKRLPRTHATSRNHPASQRSKSRSKHLRWNQSCQSNLRKHCQRWLRRSTNHNSQAALHVTTLPKRENFPRNRRYDTTILQKHTSNWRKLKGNSFVESNQFRGFGKQANSKRKVHQ